jgi:hypothetical protein
VDAEPLKPGELCSTSGIYRVYHYQHRLPHSVVLIAGDVVPRCRKCGDAGYFQFVLAGEPVSSDLDFSNSAPQANNIAAGA